MTRRLTPAAWSALATRLRASGEARAADRLNQQLLAATHYGVTGEIELMLPAGVAAAVERVEATAISTTGPHSTAFP